LRKTEAAETSAADESVSQGLRHNRTLNELHAGSNLEGYNIAALSRCQQELNR
jgi:hypothetical protein